jgi:hypothetical protein
MIDIKELDNIDLKLKLLAGDTLSTNLIEIAPLTIREVKDEGYIKYNTHLGMLMLTKEELLQQDVPELKDFGIFEIILYSGNEVMTEALVNALAFFLGEDKDDYMITDKGLILGYSRLDDAKIITPEMYLGIIEVVKYQNCVKNSNEKVSNELLMDEKARKIAEKFKKAKEDVKKAKDSARADGDEIDFADIISAVSTKSNTYNKHTVWDATVYQLYDEYKRLEMISSYETNIMAMIQGAKIENMKHWSARMEE